MKKKQFLWMLFAILVCGFTAMTMASCGDDGDDDPVRPNNPQETSGDNDQKPSQDDSQTNEMLKTPLTLEAIEAGTITFNNQAAGPVTYRVNGGEAQTIESKTKGEITVAAGDKVAFYGDNASYGTFSKAKGGSRFGGKADRYIYGNIMSLVSSTNFATATKLEGGANFASLFEKNSHLKSHPSLQLVLPATTLAESCYDCMFYGCKGLTKAPKLPATKLAKDCYYAMFSDCTGLTEAPELPATTLAGNCYSYMFKGCTGLTKAPELPAMTLAEKCYSSMFNGCTGLTKAPELPATMLKAQCYYAMFNSCTGLTKTPALPATTLADSCYANMFMSCTELTEAPELPAKKLAEMCYFAMFSTCTGLTEAPELPATTLAKNCYSGMFNSCTGLTKTPALPATTLAEGCYKGMFKFCKNLNSVTCLATSISAKDATESWLFGVSSTGTFTKAKGIKWTTGENGIPSDWTVVEK